MADVVSSSCCLFSSPRGAPRGTGGGRSFSISFVVAVVVSVGQSDLPGEGGKAGGGR